MNFELPSASLKERLLYFFGYRKGIAVTGSSMLPTLSDGEIVLVDSRRLPRTGDIVVANHPFRKSVKIIKRVFSIDREGRILLVGDNPDSSTDSRTLGSFVRKDIIGVVVCRFDSRGA